MQLTKAKLQWAVDESILTEEQCEALLTGLEQRRNTANFSLPVVLYYLGALVVIGAMTWFVTSSWEFLGGKGLLAASVIYGLTFILVGRQLYFKRKLRIPGGLMYTIAVCMTPLGVYAIERITGFWPQGDPGNYQDYYNWVKGSWIIIELATVLAGLLAMKFVRFPFLAAPVAYSLWFLSMDITAIIHGSDFSWDERIIISIVFGIAMLILAYLFDTTKKLKDYAFWFYLFGLITFWVALTAKLEEWPRVYYLLTNLGLLGLAIALQKKAIMTFGAIVILIFGAIGIYIYLGYLAYNVFKDSLLFPFVLSALGISAIFLGIAFQKYSVKLKSNK